MGAREDVEASWSRLRAWASRNAPRMLEELRGPASGETLERFERESRLELPPGLRASLQIHDGEEGPRYCCAWADGGELLSADEMLECWRRIRPLAEEPDPDEIRDALADGLIHLEGPVWAVAIHAEWIPFMLLNGGDRAWYVDLAPAPGGTPGQVIEVDPECGHWKVCADSFEAFLASYVEALEAGAYPERDADGVPCAFDDADRAPTEEDEWGDGVSAANLRRTNQAIEATTHLGALEELPPGSEADVAGVVIASRWLRSRHELSVWGGSIEVEGDLGTRSERRGMLKVRVRVPEPGPGPRIYPIVSWQPLL